MNQKLEGTIEVRVPEMCKGSRGDVVICENKVNSYSVQLKVESGLQVGEEFDNDITKYIYEIRQKC